MGILLKIAAFVDPILQTVEKIDVLVDGGIIVQMGIDLSATGHQIIDLAGKYLCPGLVDMHVHFRDPGQTEKEACTD